MSYDLTVFDRDVPDDRDELIEVLEDDSGWGVPLSPKLEAFVAELAKDFPWDDDADSCPWSSWPLEGNSMAGGKGCDFNIRWSMAEQMHDEFVSRAARHGLTLFDPQADEIIRPGAVDKSE